MISAWQTKPFEECIERAAPAAKIQRKDFLDDGAYPVISQEDSFINGYWNNEEDVLRLARPVVVFGDHTRVLKYVDFDFVLGADGVKVLQPRGFLLPKFFFYQLQAADIDTLGYARHYKLLKELVVVYPPLVEQRRIVEILDEAFAGIATVKANAERNLQNARAAFECHLHFVFGTSGQGWSQESLQNLCVHFADGDWIESKDQSPKGIRLIQTGNVGKGFFKDRGERARYISETTCRRLRCTEVYKGDCLISRLPDPVGRSCIVPDTGERMITAVDCTIVRFDTKRLLPSFFNHYAQSVNYLNAVKRKCTGTTRSRISRSNLGHMPVPVPALAEQRRLAREFDILVAEIQRLEAIYQRKLAALDELKKSLLHEAFSGRL